VAAGPFVFGFIAIAFTVPIFIFTLSVTLYQTLLCIVCFVLLFCLAF
jgi:hypothetical protein